MNAFVAGGQRIFIHSGLLMAAEAPDQVIGVIAHETGHIIGGHLARQHEGMSAASTAAILAYVLGAAAVVAGDPQAGTAIIATGSDLAQATFLRYTRTQESAADQAAIRLLHSTRQSPRGLREFFEILQGKESVMVGRASSYYRSHPLTQQRISALETATEESRYANSRVDPRLHRMHERIRAKLRGFLQPIETTLRQYPESDTSVAARYARAIAYHQDAQTERGLEVIESLLADEPDNPFFWELKGQILFESGRVYESVPAYQKAVELDPREPLLTAALGEAQIASDDPAFLEDAIANLKTSLRSDPNNTQALMQIATAYGKTDQIGLAKYYTAERYLRYGAMGDARTQAQRALQSLEEGSPEWYKAHDIINALSPADIGAIPD